MLNCEKALLAMNDVPDAYIESARAMLGYRVGEQKRFSVRKRIIAFALAAALVLSLGIAAYAVYVHWSRGMERKLPATGTEKQRAEESGLSDTSQTVSATANGVTISVEQTVIDGDTAEIALRIEGWKLDRAQELNAAIWGGFPTFDGESAPQAEALWKSAARMTARISLPPTAPLNTTSGHAPGTSWARSPAGRSA